MDDNFLLKIFTELPEDQDLPNDYNNNLFELTICPIHQTGQFDQGHFKLRYTPGNYPVLSFAKFSFACSILWLIAQLYG